MYDRTNEFDTFFDELNIDNNTGEMVRIRKKTKRKARIHHIAVAGRNVACIVAGLSLITFAGVKTSPAFADALSKLPIISEWISGAKKDEGIQKALENDCETIVNQTTKFEGGQLTLSYVVADEADIVFSFTGSVEDGYNYSRLSDIRITNFDTGAVHEFGNMPKILGENVSDHEIFELNEWLYDDEGTWNFPEKIKFEAKLISHPDQDSVKEITENDISYEVNLKKPLPPKEYAVNKEIEIMDQKINITKIVMYPTCTNVYYIYDSNNTMDLTDRLSFSIKRADGTIIDDKIETVHFGRDSKEDFSTIKSGYYTVSDGFEVILNSAELLPKDMKHVKLDIATMALTDATGVVKRAFVPSAVQLDEDDISMLKEDDDDIIIQVDNPKENVMYVYFDYEENYKDVDDEYTWPTPKEFDITPDDDSDKETGFTVISGKVAAADKDGIIHLERNFPEYSVTPDISVFRH